MADMQCYTDFQPSFEWAEDPKNHVLRIYLPGFRKGEFRVQVDKLGKLTVKGRRSLGDGKFMHLERDFAVPKDTTVNQISGKFDQGCLSLFMPKGVPDTVPQTAASSEKQPGSIERRKMDEPVAGTEKEETPKQEQETKAAAPVHEEKEKPATPVHEEKQPAAPVHEEKQPAAPVHEEKKPAAPVHEEKKPAAPVHEEKKPLTDEEKEEHLIQDEPIQKKQPVSITVSDDRCEQYKKKGLAWKETIVEEAEWWLDDGLIDGLLETISKNKKVIAIAIAAFSTGFFVSQKLRSCGR